MIYLERRAEHISYDVDYYYLVMDIKRKRTFNLIVGSFSFETTKKIDLACYGPNLPSTEKVKQDKLKYKRDYAINSLL